MSPAEYRRRIADLGKGCVEREKKAVEELRDAHYMLRAVNRMGR